MRKSFSDQKLVPTNYYSNITPFFPYLYLYLFNINILVGIPKDIPWKRDKGYPLPTDTSFECPRDRLVGVENVVNEAVGIIKEHLPAQTRVPPLALFRLYRGGKTTVVIINI